MDLSFSVNEQGRTAGDPEKKSQGSEGERGHPIIGGVCYSAVKVRSR